MNILPNYNIERELNYITKEQLKEMRNSPKTKVIGNGHSKEEMIKLIESIENGTFHGMIDSGGESFEEFLKHLKDSIYKEN